MLDTRLSGSALTPFTVEVEPQRLLAFAQATGSVADPSGQASPDREQSQAALPVPPTFFFCLEMGGPRPMEVYERLGVNYAHVLHGEQHFVYHRLAFAGERLHFSPRIADLYARKGGELEFIVWKTHVTGDDGQPVADLRNVMVVNHALAAGHSKPPSTQPALNPGVSRQPPALQTNDARLPGLVSVPLTREALAQYAAASGDDNPLHTDPAYARQAGHPDVFAHGMLSGALLARQLTQSVGQAAIRSLRLRFVAITRLGDEVHCQARISGQTGHRGEACVALELTAHNQHHEVKVTGSAIVARAP